MSDILMSILIAVLIPMSLGLMVGVGGFLVGLFISVPVVCMLLVTNLDRKCEKANPPVNPSVIYSQDSSVKILKYQLDSAVENKYIERGTKDFYIPDSMYVVCPCSGTVTIKDSK